jgi:hypothetical protein
LRSIDVTTQTAKFLIKIFYGKSAEYSYHVGCSTGGRQGMVFSEKFPNYLGRYTHRVALSNDRILSAHNAEVTFSYRDRKDQNRKKTMTLDAHEFIRRFLLHVIPKGFVRVRHFGFLANRSKGLLAKCRQLLDLSPTVPKLPTKSVHELMLQLTGIDITRCPLCQKGTLVFLANLPVPAPWDSS